MRIRSVFCLIPLVFGNAVPDCDIHSVSPHQLVSESGSIPRRLSFDSFGSVTVKCQYGENLLHNSLNCTDNIWTGSAQCGRQISSLDSPPYSDPTGYYRFSRPVEKTATFLACDHSTDLLMDWRRLNSDLAAVIASGQSLDVFVARLQPQLVRFENFFRHHKDTQFTDCPLGYFAIRAYLMLIAFPYDFDLQVAELADHLAATLAEFPLAEVLASGWFSEIIAPILATFRANYFASPSPESISIPEASEAVHALAGGDLETADRRLKYWLGSRAFGGKFYVESMLSEANIYEHLANLYIDRPNIAPVCDYQVCPLGYTWLADSCDCSQLFPVVPNTRSRICIFVSDSRDLGDIDDAFENLRYWQLTFRVNALYADLHGYKIFFHQPEPSSKRKIGWAKVLFMLEKTQREVAMCEYGVSIDSDAFFATNEPLESVINAFGLYQDRHFLFGEEYHQEGKGDEVNNANGGFFIVRNSAIGLKMLKEWYDVPELYVTHRQYAKENPQGLNYCWDSKIHDKYKEFISYAHPKLFSAPYSVMVRHNWFKDEAFEAELRRVAAERLDINEALFR